MNCKLYAVAFLFATALVAPAVTVTTTNGTGADRAVTECNYTIGSPGTTNALDTSAAGSGDQLNARWVSVSPFTNHVNEVIALRFDLTGYSLPAGTNFQLQLFNHRTNTARILHYYGVVNGAGGANNNGTVTNWTDDNWSESSSALKFSTLPGLHFDGSSATKGFSNTLDLGSATMNAVNEGIGVTFSSAALDSFIQNHPNSLVTILVGTDTSSTGQSRFTSKETTSTATALFTGAAGDFAPRLNFTVAAAPDVAGIYFQQQPTDANVGAALAPAVTVVATNASGLPVSNAVITLTLASGTGFLNGTLSQFTDGTGTATFANVSLSAAGAKQVQAAAGSNTVLSASFNITGIPPVVTALSPTNNATGRCVDTLLQMTFDKPVLLQKSGSIRIYNAASPAIPVDTLDLSLNVDQGTVTNVQPRTIGGETFTNYPVIVSGSTATLFPHAGVLAANTTYHVLMDSGVFTDTNGIAFPGIAATNVWRFTTKATGPASNTNLIVAADNSGDFCTVQGAVDFVSSGNTTPRLINIRNGTYTEIVNVNNRHNLTFRGQSRSNAIIGYANNAPMNSSTHYRMAFKVNGNDIALDSLTVTNMTPKGGGQAEALMVETDRRHFVAWNVSLCSYQDTILMNTSGTQCYFQDSLIQGDADFIWGGGNAFFTNCEIKSLFGGYLTQPRTAAGSNGLSFVKCRLTKNGAITATLGRNLGNLDGNAAFIHCLIDSHITGWTDVNLRYWEFGNSNLAASAAVSYNGTQLGATSVELTNARSVVLWLNGWSPSLLPTIVSHPTNQSLLTGQTAVFNASATGIPAPTYQWRKNGTNIANATNASYSIAGVLPADAGTYSALVSTPAGSVPSSNATLTVSIPQALAFPGAEGAGAATTGGRGGDVYYVTNLNDTGAGSFRTGISTAPAGGRAILFKVSGNIALNSTLTINMSNITVAGQSAPGDGICLQDESFNIAANNVIVRHLRTRLGTNNFAEADGMWINAGSNIIVDHLSASWSVDETLSASTDVANLTVQNCFITESLQNSIHVKGAHGYGGIISSSGNATYSYLRNLYAHHDSRNPRVGSDSQAGTLRLDFRNNVIYNWGFRAGYSGDTNENSEINYVGNYLIAGPASTSTSAFLGGAATTGIYQSGNFVDTDKDGLVDGANTGWSMFTGTYTQTNAPFDVPAATTETAGVSYQRVVALSGAMPWRRDANDQRIARTVRQQYGSLVDFVGATNQATEYTTNNILGTNYINVRGWPTLAAETAPADTDSDGMPDYWETAVGLNPNLASDRNLTNVYTGYTRLEEYLNWLADAHGLCNRNGSVDVSLRTATGGATNLTYAVASGTNGTVSLLGDGYTARFTAAPNTNGPAHFTFTVTDPVTATSFGPVSYGVLIVTNSAPVSNTAPTLAAISNYTRIAGAALTFTNSASDTDVPAQTLTFSLLNNPTNASVTTNTGIFNWRPTIAQGGSSNAMKIVVTDSGSPTMSATQAFSVFVALPANPTLQPAGMSNGQFSLLISGDAGPDYTVQASTNLVNWTSVTNAVSPALPFGWSDTNAVSFKQRFYRVLLGP